MKLSKVLLKLRREHKSYTSNIEGELGSPAAHRTGHWLWWDFRQIFGSQGLLLAFVYQFPWVWGGFVGTHCPASARVLSSSTESRWLLVTPKPLFCCHPRLAEGSRGESLHPKHWLFPLPGWYQRLCLIFPKFSISLFSSYCIFFYEQLVCFDYNWLLFSFLPFTSPLFTTPFLNIYYILLFSFSSFSIIYCIPHFGSREGRFPSHYPISPVPKIIAGLVQSLLESIASMWL